MPSFIHHPAGSLFMVVAPSGAGKSSLVNALLTREPDLRLSISYTTRTPRPGEVEEQHYYFISVEEFLERKSKNEFLECAEVHGNYYGSSRVLINQYMQAGSDVVLEIDWQGAQQVKAQFPEAVGIFILPPSIEDLAKRLKKRGQDSAQVITRRLLAAGGEIAHAPEFEYVIINTEFEAALAELMTIIKATRCRFNQQFARNSELFAQLGIHGNLSQHSHH
jgi:guanylate kinase